MALARLLAWVWYHLIPLRRATARRNVERVFGPSLSAQRKRHIVRQSFTNLCYYGMEGLRMPALTRSRAAELVQGEAMQVIAQALKRGKGVVGVTAHLGNFDLLGTSQAVRGFPIHAIVKDISWRAGHDFMQAVRQATGLGCVAPRKSRGKIVELLAKNQVVAFLIDQHLPPHRAMVCEFFGQLAATTPFPVRVAFETGAPIVPVFMVRLPEPGKHRIIAEPEFVLETPFDCLEANIRHNTERLNRLLEGWVRAYPEQWLWQHKRWKVHDKPGGWHIPTELQHLVQPERRPGVAD